MSKYERMKQAERDFIADRPAMSGGMNSQPEKAAKALQNESLELCEAIAAHSLSPTVENAVEIGQELADIFLYGMTICSIYELDMYEEVMTKIAYNQIRFSPYMFKRDKDYDTSYKNSKNQEHYKETKQDFYHG